MSTPSVSIIIVNFNAGFLLLETVVAALSSTIPVEIFVCDNHSSDGSMHFLRAGLRRRRSGFDRSPVSQDETRSAELDGVYLIENSTNAGFSAANNIAMDEAGGDFILLLNPDCIIQPDTLFRMLEVMHRFPQVGMAGCRILNQDGTEQAGCRRQLPTPLSGLLRAFNFRSLAGKKAIDLNQQPLPDHPVEVEAISGAFMLLRRSAIDDVGLMDETYFLHCEDLDYCKRFQDKGWKVLFVPDIEITHYKGTCSQSRPIRVEWYKHRGMWRYYDKFLAGQSPFYVTGVVWLGIVSRFFLIVSANIFKRLLSVFRASESTARQTPLQGSPCIEYSINWPDGLASKSVLVTGATGQVGRRLLVALQATGAKVALLSRDAQKARNQFSSEDINIIQADLTSPDTLSGACVGVDTVFHLACDPDTKGDELIGEDRKHFDVTLAGTRHLIAEAISSGVRQIIFASSVHGSADDIAQNSYAQAMRKAEKLLLDSASDSSLEVSILRFPAIYGSSEHGHVARMIAAIDSGRYLPIPEFNNRRSMIHCDDAARALLIAASSGGLKGNIFTVTDGESYSTRRLYCSIKMALGKPLPGWYLPESVLQVMAYMGDGLSKYVKHPLPYNSKVLEEQRGSAEYDGSAFAREMAFEPYYNLESALPVMVAAYRRKQDMST